MQSNLSVNSFSPAFQANTSQIQGIIERLSKKEGNQLKKKLAGLGNSTDVFVVNTEKTSAGTTVYILGVLRDNKKYDYKQLSSISAVTNALSNLNPSKYNSLFN